VPGDELDPVPGDELEAGPGTSGIQVQLPSGFGLEPGAQSTDLQLPPEQH
tara:strand:- start:315 stop:464 length:150 start_codon:yes stop_codon:yes gene_type:complete